MNPALAVLLALGATRDEASLVVERLFHTPIASTEEEAVDQLRTTLKEVRGADELVKPSGVTSLEVFDRIRERAETMLRTTFMESEREWDQRVFDGLLKPTLGVGIAAASEHYAANPEHLAIAGQPICTVCREPVQSLQVGVDPSRDEDSPVVKVAWPCGHYQS